MTPTGWTRGDTPAFNCPLYSCDGGRCDGDGECAPNPTEFLVATALCAETDGYSDNGDCEDGGGGLPFGLKLPEMPKDFDWDAEIELPGVKELTGIIRGLGEDGSNKKP